MTHLPVEATAESWRREVVAFLDAHAGRRGGVDDWSTSAGAGGSGGRGRVLRPVPRLAGDRVRRRVRRHHLAGGTRWARRRPWQQAIYREEEARYDVSSGFIASTIALAGAALMTHGRADQQARYLRPLLRADEIWCQLFSEPDAGSDLANLGTRAVADGDEFVVDGQKVWTSGAHHADFGLLLARTDPSAPKHRGITFFLLDMHTPASTCDRCAR